MKLLALAQLAIDPRAEADLRWFYTWSRGDMGLRSSHPAMVARLQVGGRTGGAPIMDIDERRLEAATRARHITRALDLLSDSQVRVLRAAYGPYARELPGLGQAAPVAPLTNSAMHAHAASHTDRCIEEWLVRLCDRVQSGIKGTRAERRACEATRATDRLTVREIAAESDALLRQAVLAFASARRALGARKK